MIKLKLLLEGDIKDKIGPDDRIIMAKKDILPLKFPVEQPDRPYMKPNGLWYSIGTEWIDWCRDEMPDGVGDHFYKIQIHENKILHLKTSWDIANFSSKYRAGKDTSFHDFIRWNDVANEYSGIEISPYNWNARHMYMWYDGWDVASGCLWNQTAIQKIEKIQI